MHQGNATDGDDIIAYPCKSPSDPTIANEQWAVVKNGTGASLASLLPGSFCMTQSPPTNASAPFVFVSMRINTYIRDGAPSNGYALYVTGSSNANQPGSWALQFGGNVLASGATSGPILPGTFYRLAVQVAVTIGGWGGGRGLFESTPECQHFAFCIMMPEFCYLHRL